MTETDATEAPRPASLAETLEAMFRPDDAEGPSLGALVERAGEKGFGLVFLVLSLPSALPVPAPGYSTPFGVAIVLLAFQMAAGREALWLPERLRRVRLRRSLAERLLGKAARFLRRLERFLHPRHRWVRSSAGRIAIGVLIAAMGSLMIFPIPLTNTAPAAVVFLVALGLSEEDGLATLAAFALGCAAAALYAGIVALLILRGPEAVEAVKDRLLGR